MHDNGVWRCALDNPQSHIPWLFVHSYLNQLNQKKFWLKTPRGKQTIFISTVLWQFLPAMDLNWFQCTDCLSSVLLWVLLPQKDQVCNLGVLLDLLDKQVAGYCGQGCILLALAGMPAVNLPRQKDLTTTTHTLVTLRLDYVGLPLEVSWVLQLVQNAAAHMLIGAHKYNHVTQYCWCYTGCS